jgi:hypothetical protein
MVQCNLWADVGETHPWTTLNDAGVKPESLQRTPGRLNLSFLYYNIKKLVKNIPGSFTPFLIDSLKLKRKKARVPSQPQAFFQWVNFCQMVESTFPQMVIYCPHPGLKPQPF